ncbi:16S rRNA (cytidine(1402)-2'-O)-methyltransferase [Portibacter lacus]|uniref:Ribosomal RNA small subunit methyltransferase I n=1 Tax=Portibacter lacus TaxID=1099794 RepID=A0AA37SRS4_9BACT|nr:16S rRNA (cytidine(1402)-2'-O)-methyltransferase [Portibacter lacus]GLR17646.1 ribosomal RNA small subunit methyltransferase I [Portibacter lacus]
MLYLVPTPIGNLGDATPRSIEILQDVQLILAEDTRNTGKLLKLLAIENRMKAFHAHNEHNQIDYVIQLLSSGQDVAMVTDAGTPGISDPGYLLVNACHENNIQVSCLPGPTAFVPALAASGLPSDKFYFEGFLPQKKGRQTRWKFLSELEYTFILYESPYRVIKCLKEIVEFCGEERKICFAREISKLHEEIKQGTAKAILEDFENRPSIKGEFVIIVSGK